MVGVDLDQRDYGEHHERDELQRQQDLLGASRELDPDVADRGHDDDPGDPDDHHVGVDGLLLPNSWKV